DVARDGWLDLRQRRACRLRPRRRTGRRPAGPGEGRVRASRSAMCAWAAAPVREDVEKLAAASVRCDRAVELGHLPIRGTTARRREGDAATRSSSRRSLMDKISKIACANIRKILQPKRQSQAVLDWSTGGGMPIGP